MPAEPRVGVIDQPRHEKPGRKSTPRRLTVVVDCAREMSAIERRVEMGVAPGVARSGGLVARVGLFDRLGRSGRVTLVSAPAGSGKSSLLRGWIVGAELAERVAWVQVASVERDPARFWLSVLDAIRATKVGAGLIGELTPAPGLNAGALSERLLADLSSLDQLLWLVIDDLQELDSDEALRQLELFLMRAPAEVRFVFLTRREVRLGFHRLRLEEGLTEIRAEDLRFSFEESRALFDRAGVRLSDAGLMQLLERTEGWVAGLRLAALSLAGHSEPERFAAEFAGSDRTVAEYLVAEVLERQAEEVRRLLLCTSILERVSGPLADLLTGRSDGQRILQGLEDAGAFVVSLDARRYWFRYHPLFADLLRLELRRIASEELLRLHALAAGWLADHGDAVAAIAHAQAAEDWLAAAQLLSENWYGLVLGGQSARAHELLRGFPAGVVAASAELTALTAAYELDLGSPEAAQLALTRVAAGGLADPDRQAHLELVVAIVRLSLARYRGDLPAVVEQARRLLVPAEAPHRALSDDVRAYALLEFGVAELWTGRFDAAAAHLERALALARRSNGPSSSLGRWRIWRRSTSSSQFGWARSAAARRSSSLSNTAGRMTLSRAWASRFMASRLPCRADSPTLSPACGAPNGPAWHGRHPRVG